MEAEENSQKPKEKFPFEQIQLESNMLKTQAMLSDLMHKSDSKITNLAQKFQIKSELKLPDLELEAF